MPEFLETVRCFQDKTCDVEEAFGGNSWGKCTKEMNGLWSLTLVTHLTRTDKRLQS